LSLIFGRPLRFALVGAVNTLTGLAVIYALKALLDADDFLANLFGYAVGLLVSLVLNSRWTFDYKGELRTVVVRFGAVVAVAYVANWIVVRELLMRDINAYVAHALGVVPYAIISYVGMKQLVYPGSQA
jgi:putative flippase GtrA